MRKKRRDGRGRLRKLPEGADEMLEAMVDKTCREKMGRRTLAREDTAVYKAVLAELARGRTRTWIRNHLGVRHDVTARILAENLDDIGRLKKIFAADTTANAMVAQNIMETQMADYVAYRDEWMRENPGRAFPVTARDIREMSMAGRNLYEMSMNSLGQATRIVETKVEKLGLEEAKKLRDELLRGVIDVTGSAETEGGGEDVA